jgi:hypothetical protein
MKVKAEFTIRDKDCFDKDIPQKEKDRIIKSISRNLSRQFNVSSWGVYIISEKGE